MIRCVLRYFTGNNSYPPSSIWSSTMKKHILLLSSLVLFVASGIAFGHAGKTDKDGCHTNKKTGERHCHDKAPAVTKSSPEVSSEPVAVQVSSIPQQNSAQVKRLDYPGFTVWLDCSRRGAVKFQYNAQHDTGNAARAEDFYKDPNVPEECQQTRAEAYGHKYDRGHLVPANHLDYSKEAIKASNYMTNILPQTATMNRGAWLLTEEIIECYRDIDELLVIGGVIWGNNSDDDYFIKSHGVATPDSFWKVIIRGKSGDERVMSWIVPNSTEATKKNLDQYLVAPAEIEKITGEKLPIPEYLRHEKPKASWLIPKGCNKS